MLKRYLIIGLIACISLCTHAEALTLDELNQKIEKDPSILYLNQHLFKDLTEQKIDQLVGNSGLNHFTFIYPVHISGGKLPALLGKKLKSLSLMAIKNAKLEAIPFQFEETDITGLIYVENNKLNPVIGTAGQLDKEDQLLFMFRDASTVPYLASSQPPSFEGNILAEIKIDREGHSSRYAYLVENNQARSSLDYVDFDLTNSRLNTSTMEFIFGPANIANVQYIAGKTGPYGNINFVDSLYVRLSAGILSRNIRVSMDTKDNIFITPIAVKKGPIREVVLAEVKIKWMGMTVYNTYINIAFYEQALMAPSRLVVDSLGAFRLFAALINEPKAEVFFDFQKLDGAEFGIQRFNHELRGYATVDGKMSPLEKDINEMRLPGEWIWLNSNKGWDVFLNNKMPVEANGMFDAFLEGVTMRLHYFDSASRMESFDRIKGASPGLGFESVGIPVIVLRLLASLDNADFNQIDSLGDMITIMLTQAQKGNLNKTNDIMIEVFKGMKNKGLANTEQEFADLLVKDMQQMHFTGPDQDIIDHIIKQSFLAGGNIETFDLEAALRAASYWADSSGVSLASIKYSVQDNIIWLPFSVGSKGPYEFGRQLNLKSTITIRNLPSTGYVPLANQ